MTKINHLDKNDVVQRKFLPNDIVRKTSKGIETALLEQEQSINILVGKSGEAK